jgi:hypothetical protein
MKKKAENTNIPLQPSLYIAGVSSRLFEGINLTTVKAEYMIGYDTYDDDQYCYILARKVGGITEILLQKTHRISNKSDKDKFESDVNKLAEYFNCEVRGH